MAPRRRLRPPHRRSANRKLSRSGVADGQRRSANLLRRQHRKHGGRRSGLAGFGMDCGPWHAGTAGGQRHGHTHDGWVAVTDEALWAVGRGTGIVALAFLTISVALGIATRSGRPLQWL